MASAGTKRSTAPKIPSFGRFIGYKIGKATAESGTCTLKVRPEHLNRSGVVHGGIMMTLIDVACSVAGQYVPPGQPPLLSASISITTSFVGNVDKGVLIATGRKTGGGKRIFFAKGEVRDGKGNLLAQGEGVFRYRSAEATEVGISRARAARQKASSRRSKR
ncbi:MAG: PaaI family thioesterase [Rhodospirillales bacterium]|nr:PaaI family thioesterase [Rhodospirillales bacterium]